MVCRASRRVWPKGQVASVFGLMLLLQLLLLMPLNLECSHIATTVMVSATVAVNVDGVAGQPAAGDNYGPVKENVDRAVGYDQHPDSRAKKESASTQAPQAPPQGTGSDTLTPPDKDFTPLAPAAGANSDTVLYHRLDSTEVARIEIGVRIMASLSVLGTSFIIMSYYLCAPMQQFAFSLIFYLALSELLSSIGYLLGNPPDGSAR